MEGGFADWAQSVREGVANATSDVITYIPNIIGALVVLLVGVIVGAVLKSAIVRLLNTVKVKPLADRVGLKQVFPGEYDVVDLIGDIVKWFFIVVFLLQALAIVNLLEVNDLVRGLLGYVPNVLAAVAVVVVGGVVADLTARLVTSATRALGSGLASTVATITRVAIWAVVAFTVLAQLGINTIFLERLFTAIVAMLALAGGLAFGLGGRDLAKDLLDGLRQSVRRERV